MQGVCNASNGRGVVGVAHNGSNATGVSGFSAAGTGVRGQSNGNTGVSGTGANYGVKGDERQQLWRVRRQAATRVCSVPAPYGTYGSGNSAGAIGTSGPGYGLYGLGSIGCVGIGDGNGYGVWGYNADSGGYGVVGQGGYRGVYASGGNAGVYGTSGYVGVWGNASTTSGLNFGVYAYSGSPGGYAGVFSGAVQVSGFLSKLGGGFLIDHPLDPDHKWLRHSFVESPDMMNVYNGNVTTNSSGVAVVKLPAYFTALNRDFRYQLTVIGKMAQAIIDQKIANNQFRIRTDQGNVEVSWQVTGIRKDDWAKEHPMVVEEAKKAHEAGGRQFVPKGSSARLMRLAPAGADAPMGAPSRLPR